MLATCYPTRYRRWLGGSVWPHRARRRAGGEYSRRYSSTGWMLRTFDRLSLRDWPFSVGRCCRYMSPTQPNLPHATGTTRRTKQACCLMDKTFVETGRPPLTRAQPNQCGNHLCQSRPRQTHGNVGSSCCNHIDIFIVHVNGPGCVYVWGGRGDMLRVWSRDGAWTGVHPFPGRTPYR